MACRDRLGSTASRQAQLALLMATVGLVTLVPGAVALVLAHHEQARIRRCESSDAGEVHVRLARVLGVVELLMLGGLGVLLFQR